MRINFFQSSLLVNFKHDLGFILNDECEKYIKLLSVEGKSFQNYGNPIRTIWIFPLKHRKNFLCFRFTAIFTYGLQLPMIYFF